jgi:hypothetical protein
MKRICPDDRWVRWLLVPAIVFISQAISDTYLLDFWHHLARGREIVTSGRLLDHDIFTYTVAGRPFQDVNWGSQVIYYHLYSLGGLDMVRVVNAFLLALAWLWLMVLCRRESGSLEAAMSVGIVTFIGAWQVLTIRPQTFSIFLFVGLFDVLLRAERDRRWLWATPWFLVAWPNLHGAFPAGLMLIGIFWVSRIGRSTLANGVWWTIAILVAAGATLVNPYGWDIYRYVGDTSGTSAHRGIDEWLPPSWNQMAGVAFFVSLPIAVAFGIAAWRRGWRPGLRECLLLACFGLLASRSIRMVVWWFLVLAPVLANQLVTIWPRLRQTEYRPNIGAAVSVAGLLAFCVLSLPPLHAFNPLRWFRPADPTTANLEEARRFLTTEYGSGNLFTQLAWGEYVGWAAYPDWKVFMDGRIEIIPDDVWKEYETITRGEAGWESILRRYGVQTLLLEEPLYRQSGLLRQLEASGEWHKTWQRGDVAVFRTAAPRKEKE